MTKAQRERVKRHAAVIAIGLSPAPQDADGECWGALRRWREGDAEDEASGPCDRAGVLIRPCRSSD